MGTTAICGEETKSIIFLNKAYVQSFKYSDTCALTFYMSFCRLMWAMQAPVKRRCLLTKASTPKAFDNYFFTFASACSLRNVILDRKRSEQEWKQNNVK